MKRTQLIVLLVGIAALAVFAADASAMYHTRMGVFMQRDPGVGSPLRLGGGGPAAGGGFMPRDQYADGMSLYQYVGGHPTQSVDPTGLYKIDVHHYMTYWLASKIPCFSDAEAKAIATADQGVDVGTGAWLGVGPLQRHINRKYHQLGPEVEDDERTQKNYLSELWAEATFVTTYRFSLKTGNMEPETERKCSLGGLGVYLHALQDSYSHKGYGVTWGHLSDLHKPDKTAGNYDNSAAMAGATWQALQDWAKQCRCSCYEEKMKGKELFVAPMGQQLADFLKSSKNLKDKVAILGISASP